MGSRRDPGYGLVVLDSRLSSDKIASKGAGTRDSAYTEAGPQPGHPVPGDTASRWRPLVVDAQSVEVDLITLRGGYPGRSGAAVAYRLATDTDAEDYRGWTDPNLPTNWTAPTEVWATAAALVGYAATSIPSSGKVLVSGCDASLNGETWEYDPRTETWTSLYDWDTGARPGLQGPIGMAYDEETGRLLIWSGGGSSGALTQIAYQSSDGGSTWSLYSRGFYDSSVTADQGALRVVPSRGQDWLGVVINDNPGSSTAKQFASSDRGVTWEVIQASMTGSQHYPIKTRRGWAVVYVDASPFYPHIRHLGSPRSDFENAAATQIGTNTPTQNVWPVVDDDGTIYVFANGSSGGTDRDEIRVYRSLDDGITWEAYSWVSTQGNDATHPVFWAAVAAGGQIHLVGTQDGATDVDGTLHLMSWGGWGNVESGPGELDLFIGPLGRFGYGSSGGGGSAVSAFWVPWDTPDNQGWTATVSTGSVDLTPSGEAGMRLSTTAGQGQVYQSTALGSADYAAAEVVFKSNSSGNSTLATVGSTSTGPHFQLTISNGSTSYAVIVDFCSDGIQVRDGAFAIRASASIDTQSSYVHVRVQLIDNGTASVWYRIEGSDPTAWILLADAVTITAGAVASCRSQFGIQTAAVGDLFFRLVGVSFNGDWRHGLDTVNTALDTPADGVRGIVFGKSLPGAGDRYPCPGLTSTSEDLGYLTARGGPSYSSETVNLPPSHTYQLEHVHPDESPSPRVLWKSTDTSEVKIVYDMGANGQAWYGNGVSLVALAAAPRQIILEVDDGSTGWTTLGTLDKGWGSINYTINGSTVVPRTGTAEISRYMHEGELVGGYLICSTSGADVARRIKRQSPGYWTTDSTVQRVVLELEDVDGTETAAGSGEIVHHSGVFVHYPTSIFARRYLRIRIASGATVPDDVYQAGILGVGRIVGVGASPSWDWSRRTELSREVTRRADGLVEVRRTGPPRVVLEHGWPDGCLLRELRTLAADPDYIGVSGGVKIGTEEDAPTSLIGVIEHQLRSGEVPAVVIPQLPSSDTTITDPTLYLYGRLLSDSQGVSAFGGTEGTDEALRVDSLAFEQLR